MYVQCGVTHCQVTLFVDRLVPAVPSEKFMLHVTAGPNSASEMMDRDTTHTVPVTWSTVSR